uniref:PDZ domain-containing protein n=1 Tax=Mesocestoides corti TaxID=53468 RepID=A0A5K3ERK2_MESCO
MNNKDLEKVRRYLHIIRNSYPMQGDSSFNHQLNKLVAVTDSHLFEEIVTRRYRYEEYIFRKKRIQRRQLSPQTLAKLRCTGTEFRERIQKVTIPRDAEVLDLEITDPGTNFLQECQRRRSSRRHRRNSVSESQESDCNWKCMGLRFGRSPRQNYGNEGLYIYKVRQENPGTASLSIGDRILAIDGIVFDDQTLDALNRDADLVDHDARSVSVAVTTFYEIVASLLEIWVNNQQSAEEVDQSKDPKRPPISLTVARCIPSAMSITPVMELDDAVQLPANHSVSNDKQFKMPKDKIEDEMMEIEMIDFPKTTSGIGAFLTPSTNGLGARVERLAKGELAETDGRLQVNDTILYINEKPVMNKTFKEVLRVYRHASVKAEATPPITPEPPVQTIRLIVSRSLREPKKPVQRSPVARSLTVPRSSVSSEAAKLAAEIKEENKSRSTSSAATPYAVSPDGQKFPDEAPFLFEVNQTPGEVDPTDLLLMYGGPRGKVDPIKRGVVIEEADSDEATEKKETPSESRHSQEIDRGVVIEAALSDVDETVSNNASASSPSGVTNGFFQAYPAKSIVPEQNKQPASQAMDRQAMSMLQNEWLTTLNEDVTILIGEYNLPSANEPLGISVETLATVDRLGRQTDYRHRLVAVREDGVIGTQTSLRPMDELLEVNGTAVRGRDSAFLTRTLQETRRSGYLVCSRPVSHIPTPARPSSTFGVDKMSAIPEVTSEEFTHTETTSVELEPGIEKVEILSSSPERISDLRRKFEKGPHGSYQQPTNALEEKEESEETQRTTQQDDFGEESLSTSDVSFASPDDSIEIIISKRKGELLGVTLGPKDDAMGGFVITDISPSGALHRTMHSVEFYKGVKANVGDVVTEIKGHRLRKSTLFSVQSLLWSMFAYEGDISFKYKHQTRTDQQQASGSVIGRYHLDADSTLEISPTRATATSKSKFATSGPFFFSMASSQPEAASSDVSDSEGHFTKTSSPLREIPPVSPQPSIPSNKSSTTQQPPSGYIKLMVERYMKNCEND